LRIILTCLLIEQDPQQNTRIQRAWLPYVEGAIKAAEEGLQKTQTLNQANGVKTERLSNYRAANTQVLNHDIATSLPMSGKLLKGKKDF